MPNDKQTVIAALRHLLGPTGRIEEQPWPGQDVVEVFALPANEESKAGGLKFTFKAGKLVEVHARNLKANADDRWEVWGVGGSKYGSTPSNQ